MTKREREFLQEALLNLKGLYIVRHCIERMDLKVMTPDEVLKSVRAGRIIECHGNVSNDIRILVRHDRNHPISICTVVSLRGSCIVTAFPNERDDKHFTLDWSQYRWKTNLEEEVKHYMAKWGSQKLSKTY